MFEVTYYARYNIRITQVFHALTFAGSRGCCLKTRPIGRVFNIRPSVQHHPRDPASFNAMKQTCVIVLVYFTLFQPNSH